MKGSEKKSDKYSKADNVDNIIGNILSDLRKNKGLSQKEFAKVLNVSEGTIAHYEQGVTIPNIEMLVKYADYFHVNVEYLLGRVMFDFEFTKLNETLCNNMKISDMVEATLKLSRDKKKYLYQTLMLLTGNDKWLFIIWRTKQ